MMSKRRRWSTYLVTSLDKHSLMVVMHKKIWHGGWTSIIVGPSCLTMVHSLVLPYLRGTAVECNQLFLTDILLAICSRLTR